MAKLPTPYESFTRRYPKIWEAYDRLGAVSHEAGPLNGKTRELLKIALSIGAKLEGAVHSHTRRAVKAGVTPAEIRHLVLLSLTTLGFPSTITAMTWVEDVLKKAGSRTRKTARR
jgi:4-carboxymuconolactone decarboxylase